VFKEHLLVYSRCRAAAEDAEDYERVNRVS
jgi:hypothetical protein